MHPFCRPFADVFAPLRELPLPNRCHLNPSRRLRRLQPGEKDHVIIIQCGTVKTDVKKKKHDYLFVFVALFHLFWLLPFSTALERHLKVEVAVKKKNN